MRLEFDDPFDYPSECERLSVSSVPSFRGLDRKMKPVVLASEPIAEYEMARSHETECRVAARGVEVAGGRSLMVAAPREPDTVRAVYLDVRRRARVLHPSSK